MKVAATGTVTPDVTQRAAQLLPDKAQPQVKQKSAGLSRRHTILPVSPVIASKAKVIGGVHVEPAKTIWIEFYTAGFAKVLDVQAWKQITHRSDAQPQERINRRQTVPRVRRVKRVEIPACKRNRGVAVLGYLQEVRQ
jgi:hypothetical protein